MNGMSCWYLKVHIGKLSSDEFPTQNGLKQGDALSPLLFNFALEYAISKSKKMKSVWNVIGHISCWSMLMMLIYWAIV
jgi:hypothetical protein